MTEVSDEAIRHLLLVGRLGFFVQVVHRASVVAGWSRRTVVLCDESVQAQQSLTIAANCNEVF